MENKTENLDSTNETDGQETEQTESTEEVMESVALKERLDKIEEQNRQLFERAKKAEAKLLNNKVEKKVEKVLEEKAGELDENALAFLDVKGITDQDEIDLIHKVMKNTGQTLREALRDDYVQTKLSKLRNEREKLDATPGSTRRAGNDSVGSIDYWKARYEQKGELPKDFALKSAVINAIESDHNGNKPAWR